MPAYKDKKTGKWYCQFYYVNWKGERKHKVKRGFERKKDAEAWEREFLSKEQNNDDLLMDCIIDEFLSHLNNEFTLGNIKQSTYTEALCAIKRHIIPYFSGAKVKDITTKQINEWITHETYNAASKKPRLASRTISSIKNKLSRIFEYAALNHGTKNPTKQATTLKPYTNNTRANFWTPQQYNVFREAVPDQRMQVLFDTLFFAGLRIGEALALTPSDIAPYSISVNKTVKHFPGSQRTVTSPKTATSNRKVEIPQFLYYEIQDIIARSYKIANNEPIFDYTHSAVYWHMSRTIRMCQELPRISPHNLRHSYASLMYQITKDITLVANNIGHKNINVTLNVYSHMLPKEKRRGLDVLEQIRSKNTEIIDVSPEKNSK